MTTAAMTSSPAWCPRTRTRPRPWWTLSGPSSGTTCPRWPRRAATARAVWRPLSRSPERTVSPAWGWALYLLLLSSSLFGVPPPPPPQLHDAVAPATGEGYEGQLCPSWEGRGGWGAPVAWRSAGGSQGWVNEDWRLLGALHSGCLGLCCLTH